MPVVLITGANRGIGLEFATQYAADKWDVIATCRDIANATALRDLSSKYPSLRIETLDVADQDAINALAARLNEKAIDLLINNAGVISGAKDMVSSRHTDTSQTFGTIEAQAWSYTLLVNTISPILVTQALMPHLKRGTEKKIVNISSRMGSIGETTGSDHIAYRTSKAALNAAMRVLLPELRSRDISVVNFHPGWVKTDMGSNAAPVSPLESVTGMRKLIAALTLKQSGQFISYDGQIIPW